MIKQILHLILRILYSLYFYTIFIVISESVYNFGILKRYRTHEQWRRLGLRVTDTVFDLTRIRISVKGREHLPSGAAIYAANHQSYLDGFIIFSIIRTPFTALTAPLEVFPFIIRKWFRKMGYVSVARDLFEELRYKDVLHHNDAVFECVQTLKKGKSLLIFPEGTRENKKKLLPFHAGVVRTAHMAQCPIIPITLQHVDDFFPSHALLLSPTHISVEIEKPLDFSSLSLDEHKDAQKLEYVIAKHLPKRYLNEHSIPSIPHGKRAAFFDLDGTLTKRTIYIYQLLVQRYLSKHFDIKEVFRVLRLGYEKFSLKHGAFYQSAIRLLKNIDERELLDSFYDFLKKEKTHIFHQEMLNLIELHRKNENLVFIITEEPQEMLEAVERLLCVPCFGTHIEKENHIFTGRILGHIMKDEWKREKMISLAHEHGINLHKSYAYGNSWNDYAMLRIVEHPTLIQPRRSLAKEGRKNGFRIVSSIT